MENLFLFNHFNLNQILFDKPFYFLCQIRVISSPLLIPLFIISTLESTYPFPSVSNKSNASLISKISSSVRPGLSYYLGLNPLFLSIIFKFNILLFKILLKFLNIFINYIY